MKTKSKLLIAGVITAAAAGAVLGLLYTDKGKEITESAKWEAKKLRKRAKKTAEQLRAQSEGVKAELANKYEAGKQRWQSKLKKSNDSLHADIEAGIENTLS